MRYAEYAAAEEQSAARHEYRAGEVVAMPRRSIEHGALAAAIIAELGRDLRGHTSRIFTSDVRIHVRAADLGTYPDVTVVFGKLETDPEDAHSITNPVLLVEILSDGTEAYDRGEKAAAYRHIPSLREYLFVSQRARRIEVYRRNAAARWDLFEFVAGQHAELASVGCTLDVDAVYRDPLTAS